MKTLLIATTLIVSTGIFASETAKTSVPKLKLPAKMIGSTGPCIAPIKYDANLKAGK